MISGGKAGGKIATGGRELEMH